MESIFGQMASFGDGTIDGDDVVEAHGFVSLGQLRAMLTAAENVDYEILVDFIKSAHNHNFVGILSDMERQLQGPSDFHEVRKGALER